MGSEGSTEGGRKITLEDFDLVRLVGKGAFGKVWQVRKKDTGEIFALKVLDKKTVVEQNLVEHTVFERDVMLTCNNPFIINLYYAFQNEENLYFVLDFVGGGSLFTVLRDHPLGYFTESQGKFYAAEILLGIEELHKNGIVYRDLKLENVLLGIDGHIILTDFGLSARLPKNEDGGKLHSFSGTAIYLAPEVLLGEGHDHSVDWWSYGILVHLLLTGEPPFWSENRRELFDMIVFGQTIIDDPLLSPDAVDLITKLLNRNTNQRLGSISGAEEIKKHRFFHGLNWHHVLKRKLKPPHVPKQEFLLTTRAEPMEIPSNSNLTGEDSSEEMAIQSDYDFFQGFSFAADRQPHTEHRKKALSKFTYHETIKPVTKKRPKGLSLTTGSKEKRKLAIHQPKRKVKKKRTVNQEGEPAAPPVLRVSTELPQLKLALLKDQASRDNRNRTFISVGGDNQEAKIEEKNTEEREEKVFKRSHSFTESDLEDLSSDTSFVIKKHEKRKKKHKSSNLVSLLSPRRRSQIVHHGGNCEKCNVDISVSNNYTCKTCNVGVCRNCLSQGASIGQEIVGEILRQRLCVTCYYAQCIQNMRLQHT